MLTPARTANVIFEHPCNPLAGTAYDRTIVAACQLLETTTRPYDSLATMLLDCQQVDVSESVVWERPFGRAIAFDRKLRRPAARPKPPSGR